MTLNRRYLEERYGESLKDWAPAIFKCAVCGEKYECEYINEYEHDGESVCEFCLKDYFRRCENCGAIWEKEKGMVCSKCGEIEEEVADGQ